MPTTQRKLRLPPSMSTWEVATFSFHGSNHHNKNYTRIAAPAAELG